MTSIADLITNPDRVAGPTGSAHAPRACRFTLIVADLDNADRDAVLTAIRGRDVSDERLASILDRGGHPISHATIRRHRVGLCRCPEATTPTDTEGTDQ